MRLDRYLVANGYFESRNRAAEAISSGSVLIDDKTAKPSQQVTANSKIEIKDEKFYVSRAAKKLEQFLKSYPLDLMNKQALDIGSSTGGFAQIVLESGAVSLDCVDVGSDQLHHSLRKHPAITLHEKTDIRDFKADKRFNLITCDVSFVSILHIVDSINRLKDNKCDIVILYKPQFEVGREIKRDSRGVVLNQDVIKQNMDGFVLSCTELGWQLKYHALSEISGKEGNQEYIYHFTTGESHE
ncbi:MAG: TlyA family RNA methyltransferase [Sulfurovum sp.]|nr:TlyA family RNA methyltransferase [Sulfurovum sp.]